MRKYWLKKSAIAALFALCSCASSNTVPLPAKPQVQTPVQGKGPPALYWVSAVGGLRIRSQPSMDGEVVGLLEQGAEIELDDSASAHEATISGRKGYWRKYREGWIFDGYLERARRAYHGNRTTGIPVYQSPAQGNPVRTLPPGTPVIVAAHTQPMGAFSSTGNEPANPEWIGGTISERVCDYSRTDVLWVNKDDLRPAAPRWPFCTDSVKRNCIDPALKRYLMAGTVNDRQDCVYQTALTLYPEGEVISCPGRIGTWTLQPDGSIAVALHTRSYLARMGPGDTGIMITRPPLIYIRKVNVNQLRFPADMQTHWPEWRDYIRKNYFGGQDSGFLPVTPDNKPFAVFAAEC